MNAGLSSGAKDLNFGLSLNLHHSLCVQAVKTLKRLHVGSFEAKLLEYVILYWLLG